MNLPQQYLNAQSRAATTSGRLALKALIVTGLTIVILIALYMISDTIESRQGYRDEAARSIAESYASSQTIVGPVLVRPFTVTSHATEEDEKGVKRIVEHKREGVSWSFPRQLDVTGTLVPSEHRHGLYKVPTYELDSHFAGTVEVAEAVLAEGEAAQGVVYGAPYFAVAVSDVRGIVGTPRVTIDNKPAQMYQGVPQAASWKPNLQIPVPVPAQGLHGRLAFALDLTLAGTERLDVAPIGDSNHIELTSTWPSPLFAGRFLPHSLAVGPEGFKAAWDLSSLASATQVQMIDHSENLDLLDVDLITPIDPYKLSDRAVKYGILFVIVTFGGFFIFEIMKHLPIHPVQYLLIGLGLAIFFLLLISFSEHMAFGAAYLVASAACIGLLTFYLTYVLHSLPYGLTFGSLLTLLYGGIYGLLVSEDNALVLGSLMLFGLLALVMYVTRKVDWYRGGAEPVTPEQAAA